METFSSDEIVSKYITDIDIRRQYLESIYRYLVKRKYFSLVRQLLNDKVPPLDEPVESPPTPLSETLLQMVQHPLKLLAAKPANELHDTIISHECATIILSSFVDEILIPKSLPAIRYFVVPSLSTWTAFPFQDLLQYLYDSTIERTNSIIEVNQQQRIEQIFTSPYCFEAFLLLDTLHQSQIHSDIRLVKCYIRVIGRFSDNWRHLEQRTAPSIFHHMDTDITEDYDSDDDDSPTELIAVDVRECLLSAIQLVNADKRVDIIVERNDCFLDDESTIHSLCKICHNLMLYHRMAVLEYRYV